MTTKKLNVRSLKKRTRKAQQAKAEAFIEELTGKLRKSASEGESSLMAFSLASMPVYGRMSFDGNSEHLSGFHKIVWDFLKAEGLNPVILSTKGERRYFGEDLIGGVDCCYIFASWSGDNTEDSGFLAQELRSLRDAAVAGEAQKMIEKIHAAIEEAVEAGKEWTSVFSFYGLKKPNALLPFDGKKENLSGTAKLVWAYLESKGLNPRLYNVVVPRVWINGLGHVDYGDNGRGYRIAACWYDQPEKEDE